MSSMLFVVCANGWHTTILQNSAKFCFPIRIARSLGNINTMNTIGFDALFLHGYHDFGHYSHSFIEKNNTNQKEKQITKIWIGHRKSYMEIFKRYNFIIDIKRPLVMIIHTVYNVICFFSLRQACWVIQIYLFDVYQLNKEGILT